MSRPLSQPSHPLGRRNSFAHMHTYTRICTYICLTHSASSLWKSAHLHSAINLKRQRETGTKRERVCVNQCNGARTSVALKREKTCGGQDMISFFSPLFMKKSSDTAHLSLPATQLFLQSLKRDKKQRGNKVDWVKWWNGQNYGMVFQSVALIFLTLYFYTDFIYYLNFIVFMEFYLRASKNF